MDKKLKTKSVCPVCLKVVDAEYMEKNNLEKENVWSGVFMEKDCPAHGHFSTLIWEDSMEIFLRLMSGVSEGNSKYGSKEVEKGCPYDCGLCMDHQQETCCILFEVTNRCNLKCPVCFADSSEGGQQDPTIQEIQYWMDETMKNNGSFNLQLSGGEPTVREDLEEIIQRGKKSGFQFIQVNTNGIRIASQQGYLESLKEAGLDCVFLQFDGLTEESYLALRGSNLLDIKKQVIEKCKQAQIGVVLVCTLVPNVNIQQIGPIIEFALSELPVVRGVHFQPVSYFGRCEIEPFVHRITIPEILRQIEKQTNSLMKIDDFSYGQAEHSLCSFHGSFLKKENGAVRANHSENLKSDCSAKATQQYVAARWKKPEKEGSSCCCNQKEQYSIQSLDDFMNLIHSQTLVISGMAFQDAYTLDLNRLKRCIVHECGANGEKIPFCAFNLTNNQGESLYRKKG